MFDFLSIAGRCKKSHRFAAYVVGCLTIIATLVLIILILNSLSSMLETLSTYEELSINLLNLIEFKAIR